MGARFSGAAVDLGAISASVAANAAALTALPDISADLTEIKDARALEAVGPRAVPQNKRGEFDWMGDVKNRLFRVTRTVDFSVASGAITAVEFDGYADQFEGIYSTVAPAVLTIPDHLHNHEIEITGGVVFGYAATGLRQAEIVVSGTGFDKKRGAAFNHTAQEDATHTPQPYLPVTWAGKVQAGNTVSLNVYQASGAALNVRSGTYLEIKVTRRPVGVGENAEFCIPQGAYSLMAADEDAFARECAKHSLAILTHADVHLVDLLPNTTTGPDYDASDLATYDGCHDNAGGFPWRRMVRLLRGYNPDCEIAAYIAPCADAGAGTTCGYDLVGGPEWFPVGGELPNVLAWIQWYDSLPYDLRPTHIFYDVIAAFSNGGWVNGEIRDICYGYAKRYGFSIVANSTNPSWLNALFAMEGMTAGDYIFVEGWKRVKGVDFGSEMPAFAATVDGRRHRGIKIAGCYTLPADTVPTETHWNELRQSAQDYMQQGDKVHINSYLLNQFFGQAFT